VVALTWGSSSSSVAGQPQQRRSSDGTGFIHALLDILATDLTDKVMPV
jgi:hypothetical protein